MSNSRGIFESFPNQPEARQDAPFAIVYESASSPFAAPVGQDSPFAVVEEADEKSLQVKPGSPVRVPERRKVESQFQT